MKIFKDRFKNIDFDRDGNINSKEIGRYRKLFGHEVRIEDEHFKIQNKELLNVIDQ